VRCSKKSPSRVSTFYPFPHHSEEIGRAQFAPGPIAWGTGFAQWYAIDLASISHVLRSGARVHKIPLVGSINLYSITVVQYLTKICGNGTIEP